jgi:hypothetical protein
MGSNYHFFKMLRHVRSFVEEQKEQKDMVTLAGPRKSGVDFSDLNAVIERMDEQARECEYCHRVMLRVEYELICKNCGFRRPFPAKFGR